MFLNQRSGGRSERNERSDRSDRMELVAESEPFLDTESAELVENDVSDKMTNKPLKSSKSDASSPQMSRAQIIAIACGVTALLFLIAWFGGTFDSPPANLTKNTLPDDFKVAIIGGGISGIGAALTLEEAGVSWEIFEKESHVGGHAFAHGPSEEFSYDMGFIFGHGEYGGLVPLYDSYDVDVYDTFLEFSATRASDPNYMYATDLPEGGSMSARLSYEIDLWQNLSLANKKNSYYNLIPLGWVLRYHGFGEEFMDYCLYPALSILFISKNGFLEQSARFIFNMFEGHHAWINCRTRQKCWTIKRSTKEFIKKFEEKYADKINLGQGVNLVEQIAAGSDGKKKIRLNGEDSNAMKFDAVVATVETFEISRMYATNLVEKTVLGLYEYEKHYTVMHQDVGMLPEQPEYRRNFNFVKLSEPGWDGSDKILYHLTGVMSNVQHRENGAEKTFDPANMDLNVLVTNVPYENKWVLDDRLDKSTILVEKIWYHLSMTVKTMACVYLEMHHVVETQSIKFAGSWVATVAHSMSFESGKKAADAIIKANPAYMDVKQKFYAFFFISLYLTIHAITWISVIGYGKGIELWNKYGKNNRGELMEARNITRLQRCGVNLIIAVLAFILCVAIEN